MFVHCFNIPFLLFPSLTSQLKTGTRCRVCFTSHRGLTGDAKPMQTPVSYADGEAINEASDGHQLVLRESAVWIPDKPT